MRDAASGARTIIVQPASHPTATFEIRWLALVAIGAGAFNALNAGAVAWVQFHRHGFVPVWGAGGIMLNSLPSSILPAVLMSLLGSLAARLHLLALGWPPPPVHSWVRLLPVKLIGRAAVLTSFAALAAVAATYIGIRWSGVDAVSFFAVMIAQLLQAFVTGLILSPIIVLRVLCETRFS